MSFAPIDINISIQLKQMRRSVREKHFHSIENNRALATFRAGDSAEMSEPMPAHSSRGSRTSPAPMTDSPSMRESAENHFPKRTSAFIHAGAAHFHIQKMGKLQRISDYWRIGGLARRATPKVNLRIRCGRNLAPALLFGNPIHVLCENMVRTKSRGAILLGNFSAHHENTVRTNSRRVQKTQKRRKGLRLSRPFRPLPLIRGSGLPNVTCKV